MAARRNVPLHVMLTAEERELLDRIALERGLTASDVVRQLLREERRRLGLPATPPKGRRS